MHDYKQHLHYIVYYANIYNSDGWTSYVWDDIFIPGYEYLGTIRFLECTYTKTGVFTRTFYVLINVGDYFMICLKSWITFL